MVRGRAASMWLKEDRPWPPPTQQLPKQGLLLPHGATAGLWPVWDAVRGCGGSEMTVCWQWDGACAHCGFCGAVACVPAGPTEPREAWQIGGLHATCPDPLPCQGH